MATESNFLRQQVFALLRESTTSVGEDLEALSQCMAHIRNRLIVEDIARDCGLTLARFLTNDNLELYYTIRRGATTWALSPKAGRTPDSGWAILWRSVAGTRMW